MRNQEALQPKQDEFNRLGGVALVGAEIKFADLGVNDPLAHLLQYRTHSEAALEFIEEDFITDCGERIQDAKFINMVGFNLAENDFVSQKGNFSMKKMTSDTENKMRQLGADSRLQQRAKIEAEEPYRLLAWFPGAGEDEVFVVDSLPVAPNEAYAIRRIYKKTDGNLRMAVVILHNPSVQVFNEFHTRIGANTLPSASALGVLDNMYTLKIPEGLMFEEFLCRQIDAYDETLASQNPGQEFVFGLPEEQKRELPDTIDMIRRQKPLTAIYRDAIKALGDSNLLADKKVLAINRRLGLDMNFSEGHPIGLEQARAMLDGVQQYIVSTLNRAPEATLDMLSTIAEENPEAAYGVAGHFGAEARSEGVRYESSACPTVLTATNSAELSAMQTAFRLNKDPTKCVLCPGCSSIVDLPKNLYKGKNKIKKEILHCVNCKLTVDKKGKPISKQEYELLFSGQEKPQQPDSFDIIAADLARITEKNKQQELAKRQRAELAASDSRKLKQSA